MFSLLFKAKHQHCTDGVRFRSEHEAKEKARSLVYNDLKSATPFGNWRKVRDETCKLIPSKSDLGDKWPKGCEANVSEDIS